jgi:hypothetical protein
MIYEDTTGYPNEDTVWISDNTWDIADKRRQVKIQMNGMYNTCKRKEVEKDYASLEKEVKKLIWRS